MLSTRTAALLARYPVPRRLRAARGPETKPGPYAGDRRPLARIVAAQGPPPPLCPPRSPARPHLPRDKGRAATGSPRPRPPLPRPLLSRPRPRFRATRAGASANRKRRSGALGRPLANGERRRATPRAVLLRLAMAAHGWERSRVPDGCPGPARSGGRGTGVRPPTLYRADPRAATPRSTERAFIFWHFSLWIYSRNRYPTHTSCKQSSVLLSIRDKYSALLARCFQRSKRKGLLINGVLFLLSPPPAPPPAVRLRSCCGLSSFISYNRSPSQHISKRGHRMGAARLEAGGNPTARPWRNEHMHSAGKSGTDRIRAERNEASRTAADGCRGPAERGALRGGLHSADIIVSFNDTITFEMMKHKFISENASAGVREPGGG